MSSKMLGNFLLYSWKLLYTDLCVGSSFDFVEDQAMLDKQQGHSSSIYALFAICSPTTGWKTLQKSSHNIMGLLLWEIRRNREVMSISVNSFRPPGILNF